MRERKHLLIAFLVVQALLGAWAYRVVPWDPPPVVVVTPTQQPSTALDRARVIPASPSGGPQGEQIFPSPGASGVPYGKQRYDLTSIPVALALTSVIDMPDLTSEQARRLLDIARQAEPLVAGERDLDHAFCDTCMQILTPQQRTYMYVNRHSRLQKVPDDTIRGNLYSFVADFLAGRAEGQPPPQSLVPVTLTVDVQLAPEEIMRGFLKLEDGPHPLTAKQARYLLPHARSYGDMRQRLRGLEKVLVDVLSEPQKRKLEAIHHDVTYDLPPAKPIAAIREALERVAR